MQPTRQKPRPAVKQDAPLVGQCPPSPTWKSRPGHCILPPATITLPSSRSHKLTLRDPTHTLSIPRVSSAGSHAACCPEVPAETFGG